MHHTSSCKAISLTALRLLHWQQSLMLVQHTHTKQRCKPLLVRGSSQCQLCSKPRAVYAARSSLDLSEEAGMRTSVLQHSSLTLHATTTTSMFVDRICFQQVTSWMRHFIATTA
jgi:DTW domain-containing protein YfiP